MSTRQRSNTHYRTYSFRLSLAFLSRLFFPSTAQSISFLPLSELSFTFPFGLSYSKMHMLNLLGSWQHAGTERHSPLVMGGVLDVWLAGATATFILCRLFAIRPPIFHHFFFARINSVSC